MQIGRGDIVESIETSRNWTGDTDELVVCHCEMHQNGQSVAARRKVASDKSTLKPTSSMDQRQMMLQFDVC